MLNILSLLIAVSQHCTSYLNPPYVVRLLFDFIWPTCLIANAHKLVFSRVDKPIDISSSFSNPCHKGKRNNLSEMDSVFIIVPLVRHNVRPTGDA